MNNKDHLVGQLTNIEVSQSPGAVEPSPVSSCSRALKTWTALAGPAPERNMVLNDHLDNL